MSVRLLLIHPGARKVRTRRMNRHGLDGRFIASLDVETEIALTNHAPCKRHWIRCCFTNSKDSLYNFLRRFLDEHQDVANANADACTHRTGTLFSKSSSISNSFICRSLTERYSLSRKSCSTSCHGRTFSSRNATFNLQTTSVSTFERERNRPHAHWLRVSATTRGKSVTAAPLSFHILDRAQVSNTVCISWSPGHT